MHRHTLEGADGPVEAGRAVRAPGSVPPAARGVGRVSRTTARAYADT